MTQKTRAPRVRTMADGLNQVWQAIGCDVLQATGDGDESVTMTGEEVAAVVVDYADTYLPDDMKLQWRAASYEQRHVWLDEAFSAKSLYGF